MIHDTLEHTALYAGITPGIAAALKYLRETDLANLPTGRHEISGKDLIAIVEEYESRPPEKCFWEAHRKYIDVQCVVRGAERMGHAELARLTVTQAYLEEKDVLKLADPERAGSFVNVRAGSFAIFFPHDAHMPGLADGAPAPVKKVVLKVRVT